MSVEEREMVEVEAHLISNMEMNLAASIAEGKQLREQLAASRNGKLIFSKMLAVKNDIGAVSKDQVNSGQGWNFRGIDQFVNALHPILNKHGVGVSLDVKQNAESYQTVALSNGKERTTKNTRLIMEYTFFAEDGSSIKCSVPGEGADPGDKGTNKALSAALKYCLIQTFFVPTQDMAEGDRDIVTIDGTETEKKTATATNGRAATTKASSSTPAKRKFRPKTAAKETKTEDTEGVTEL